jgi:hypothetical protein
MGLIAALMPGYAAVNAIDVELVFIVPKHCPNW